MDSTQGKCRAQSSLGHYIAFHHVSSPPIKSNTIPLCLYGTFWYVAMVYKEDPSLPGIFDFSVAHPHSISDEDTFPRLPEWHVC